MTATGFAPATALVSDGWSAAYARLHREGDARHPPACLYYVMNLVRFLAAKPAAETDPVVGDADIIDADTVDAAKGPVAAGKASASVSPSALTAAFRDAARADFGPLRDEVLRDWGLLTPADLGLAVALLGRAGCLTLDDRDAPGFYARDTTPFTATPAGDSP